MSCKYNYAALTRNMVTLMEELLIAYFIGIVSSLTATAIISSHIRRTLVYILFYPVSHIKYLSGLKRTMQAMPFIYKDIDTDVLNDFVDIQIATLNPNTLGLKYGCKISSDAADQKIRDNIPSEICPGPKRKLPPRSAIPKKSLFPSALLL